MVADLAKTVDLSNPISVQLSRPQIHEYRMQETIKPFRVVETDLNVNIQHEAPLIIGYLALLHQSPSEAFKARRQNVNDVTPRVSDIQKLTT